MLFRRKYDVFISYAIEDKTEVARVIAGYLKKRKIKVWFAGNELKVGAEISSLIGSGLRNSSYCIIIISPHYTRHWPAVELYRFLELEKAKSGTLLFPVWHGVNYEKVKRDHPLIADRHALLTSNGMETVCAALYHEIVSRKKSDCWRNLRKTFVASAFLLLFSFLSLLVFKEYFGAAQPIPDKQSLAAIVQKRIIDFESQTENSLREKIATDNGHPLSLDSIFILYNSYVNRSNYDRNEFRFSNGYSAISGLKNIKAAGVSITAAPYTGYGITSPSCYLFEKDRQTDSDSAFYSSFVLLNNDPASFTVDTVFIAEEKVHLLVTYTQNIRNVDVTLSYPLKPGNIRKEQVSITGYKPTEEYVLEQKNNLWVLCEIK